MILALLTGFVVLMSYGIRRGFSLGALGRMAISGVATVKNIAIVMLLVGALTALWRCGGTIAFIVSHAAAVLRPAMFLPAAFLLCTAISVLTGTSIGTAATMGVICMSVGNTLGFDPALTGGAILAGAYFGDRCSPVSTSAILVSELTKTNIYYNIKAMLNTCIGAFVISIGLYVALGYMMLPNAGDVTDAASITELFSGCFKLHWLTTLPAIAIVVLALFKTNVKIVMSVSIALSAFICYYIQDIEPREILNIAIFGFDGPEEIAHMMNGGGVISMLRMIFIVMISLTYAGLFKGMGLMQKLESWALRASKKVSPYGCTVLTAVATCALSCNQTLSIVLTEQICQKVVPDNYHRAIYLENSSVIIAPLVPWTVASLIPIGVIGADASCIFYAFFLYLIPATNLLFQKIRGFYN